MSRHAKGTFEVTITPLALENKELGAVVAAMAITKHFVGGLEGTSKGEMLAVNTSVEGSAGYVAMEQVTGTLSGKNGTFTLQHSATMNRGVPQLGITVIPDSGTGELIGLTGQIMIEIEDGKHSYDFAYELNS